MPPSTSAKVAARGALDRHDRHDVGPALGHRVPAELEDHRDAADSDRRCAAGRRRTRRGRRPRRPADRHADPAAEVDDLDRAAVLAQPGGERERVAARGRAGAPRSRRCCRCSRGSRAGGRRAARGCASPPGSRRPRRPRTCSWARSSRCPPRASCGPGLTRSSTGWRTPAAAATAATRAASAADSTTIKPTPHDTASAISRSRLRRAGVEHAAGVEPRRADRLQLPRASTRPPHSPGAAARRPGRGCRWP